MSTNNLKKAVVTWGSNGIGLVKVIKFVSESYLNETLDKEEPEKAITLIVSYDYCFCDFLISQVRNIA